MRMKKKKKIIDIIAFSSNCSECGGLWYINTIGFCIEPRKQCKHTKHSKCCIAICSRK